MEWLLFAFTVFGWLVIIASCLPGVWPSRVHEWIEGHRKLAQDELLSLDLIRSDGEGAPIEQPWRARLTAAFNEAEFIEKRRVPLRGRVHLRFVLKKDAQALVWCARRDDDIYIERVRSGRVYKAYWAHQPELHSFLANRPWLSSTRLKNWHIPSPPA